MGCEREQRRSGVADEGGDERKPVQDE